ncbi:DUF2799 domain-containing protein [Neptuniibacter sp. QD34_54]|uniref:DUF2799 domain-containing protein n=1 Tax=Neptuniibacter sp. QD34_54 TaxID=3398208 RepID=UPI0039F5B628
MRSLILASLFVILPGCASLSQEECLTGDWQGIGYRDGLQGKAEAYLAEHQSACAEYRVSLNLEDYLHGRNEGLKRYCQPDNAYRLGRQGATYAYVCPVELEGAFIAKYQQGREVYQQEKAVKSLEADIRKNKAAQKKLKDQIIKTETKLVAEGKSRSERQRLLDDLKDMEQRLPNLKAELFRMELKLLREKAALQKLL